VDEVPKTALSRWSRQRKHDVRHTSCSAHEGRRAVGIVGEVSLTALRLGICWERLRPTTFSVAKVEGGFGAQRVDA
jgi:hypothetical protein